MVLIPEGKPIKYLLLWICFPPKSWHQLLLKFFPFSHQIHLKTHYKTLFQKLLFYKVSTIIRKGQLFPWKNNSVSLEACNFYSLKSWCLKVDNMRFLQKILFQNLSPKYKTENRFLLVWFYYICCIYGVMLYLQEDKKWLMK